MFEEKNPNLYKIWCHRHKCVRTKLRREKKLDLLQITFLKKSFTRDMDMTYDFSSLRYIFPFTETLVLVIGSKKHLLKTSYQAILFFNFLLCCRREIESEAYMSARSVIDISISPNHSFVHEEGCNPHVAKHLIFAADKKTRGVLRYLIIAKLPFARLFYRHSLEKQ